MVVKAEKKRGAHRHAVGSGKMEASWTAKTGDGNRKRKKKNKHSDIPEASGCFWVF